MAVHAKNKCGATLFWLVVHLCVASVSGPAKFKTQVYDYVYVDTGPQRFQDSTEEEEEFWKTLWLL